MTWAELIRRLRSAEAVRAGQGGGDQGPNGLYVADVPLAGLAAGSHTLTFEARVPPDDRSASSPETAFEVRRVEPAPSAETPAAPVRSDDRVAPATALPQVMERAGRYVIEYGEQMSLLIGVEDYAQWVDEADVVGGSADPGRTRRWRRDLVSEFALVRVTDDWLGFRDVYQVDGKPVQDRQDRLLRLFTETPATAREQGRRIADESARYNVGAMQRNFNVPTMALFFAHPKNQSRFRFRKDGEDTIGGVLVWKVRFDERQKPTIIRTRAGKDMPVSGTLWVDPISGRVLKTHMEIKGEAMLSGDSGRMGQSWEGTVRANQEWANRRVDTSASMTVTYRQDQRLGLLVPSEMLETYEGPTISQVSGKEAISKISCRATYSGFKRFETSGRVVVPK